MQPSRQFALILILALLLAACGSAALPTQRAASEAPGALMATMVPEKSAMDSAAEPESMGGAVAQAQQVQRKIIRDVNLTVRFEDVLGAADKIKGIAATRGGYVVQTNIYETGEKQYQGTITLRVDADQLDVALSEIKALGIETINEQSSATDVTEEYVDLSARLDNLKRTETELQELLTEVRKNSKKAEEVLAIYRELTEIRGQIESIQGRMKMIDTLSSLATISVSLVPPTAIVANPGWSLGGTVGEALRTLVSALQVVATLGVNLIIVGLPLLVIAFLPLGLLVFALRRWRRGRTIAPTG